MKKDRDCSCSAGATSPYPTFQPYPMGMPGMQMMPVPAVPGMGMPGMQMMPGMTGVPTNYPSASSSATQSNANATSGINTNQAVTAYEQLQAQVNNLDRRVSRLESMIQDTKTSQYSSNKYTDSNYHMM